MGGRRGLSRLPRPEAGRGGNPALPGIGNGRYARLPGGTVYLPGVYLPFGYFILGHNPWHNDDEKQHEQGGRREETKQPRQGRRPAPHPNSGAIPPAPVTGADRRPLPQDLTGILSTCTELPWTAHQETINGINKTRQKALNRR